MKKLIDNQPQQPRGSSRRGWIALALAVLLLVLPVAHVGVKAVANLAHFNANFDCGAC